MSGVKGKSGRKRKSLSRDDANRSLTLKLPKAIEVISDTMEGKNKDRLQYEAAINIKDSVMGKPRQQTDMSVKLESKPFTGDDYELIARAQIDEQKLLVEYKEEDDATEQRGSQGIHEEV